MIYNFDSDVRVTGSCTKADDDHSLVYISHTIWLPWPATAPTNTERSSCPPEKIIMHALLPHTQANIRSLEQRQPDIRPACHVADNHIADNHVAEKHVRLAKQDLPRYDSRDTLYHYHCYSTLQGRSTPYGKSRNDVLGRRAGAEVRTALPTRRPAGMDTPAVRYVSKDSSNWIASPSELCLDLIVLDAK